MILKYKIHYKFYCVVYSIIIYLLHTDTRLGRLCCIQLFDNKVNYMHLQRFMGKGYSIRSFNFTFRSF
jgi:hypothetical protein